MNGPRITLEDWQEANWPALFLWLRPFRQSTPHANQTLEEFVHQERERQGQITAWSVVRDGELGAYIEMEPQANRVAFLTMYLKKSFFREDIALPALRLAFDRVFAAGAELILMTPVYSHKQMAKWIRSFGAAQVGHVPAGDGAPERRVLGLAVGDWGNFLSGEAERERIRAFDDTLNLNQAVAI